MSNINNSNQNKTTNSYNFNLQNNKLYQKRMEKNYQTNSYSDSYNQNNSYSSLYKKDSDNKSNTKQTLNK